MNASTIPLKIPHKHDNKPTVIKHTLLLRHCFKCLTWMMTILKTALQEDQEMGPQSHNRGLETGMWRGLVLHAPELLAQCGAHSHLLSFPVSESLALARQRVPV